MNLLFVLLNVRIKDNRFVMWNKNDIAFTGAILWTILFSKLPGNKGLQFIGKHGVTYMCLQLFTLSVSHKVFSKLISNPVILGWIGIGVTLVGVGIVIEMYDRLRMLMKMKCNSNGLLRP